MRISPPPELEPRYVVVQQPRHPLLRNASWLGGAVLSGFIAGVFVGYPLGYREVHLDVARAAQMESDLEQTRAQLETMRSELAVHKHGSEVERQVSEHLRHEIVDLQSRLLEQEQTITFYKNILDPEKNQGLAVHSLELVRKPVAGRFSFKLVLLQPIDSATEISGTAIISVSGLHSGKQMRLDWKALAEGRPAPAYKFKVFQEISGDLKLPEAFIPEKIEVRLDRAGGKPGVVGEYPWTLKEAP